MITNLILTPVSWVYGLVTGLRNLLYDRSVLRSYHPDIPVIVVGNLIAGGTGKTPVVAWIAGELAKKYRVAILSRGYGRRTRGFLVAGNEATPDSIGDEPMELHLLLPDVTIALDSNRTRGLRNLAGGKYGKFDLVIMDDGFQHRKVAPGYSIVLDDFNRPMRREKLLPAGLRREPLSGLARADLVVVTKKELPVDLPQSTAPILLVTGIANPGPLEKAIAGTGRLLRHLKYPDHHRYTNADGASIGNIYKTLRAAAAPQIPVLLTTGKDYVKLSRLPELHDLPLERIRYGPPVDPHEQPEILKKIYQYVEKTQRNS